MGPCRWNRRIGLFAPDRGCIHTMPSAEPSSQHLLSGRLVAREPWIARSESSRPSSSLKWLRSTSPDPTRSSSIAKRNTFLRSAVLDIEREPPTPSQAASPSPGDGRHACDLYENADVAAPAGAFPGDRHRRRLRRGASERRRRQESESDKGGRRRESAFNPVEQAGGRRARSGATRARPGQRTPPTRAQWRG